MNVAITFDANVANLHVGRWADCGTIFMEWCKPGAAHWHKTADGVCYSLHFICPCGCSALVPITIKTPQHNGWVWNGNMEKPSMSPSIQRTAGCRWHGYLTDGEFKSC